ncbi:MAG: APC family permease [Anaerolineaceae bacterium]|nr:APC family permease [Anaerolineaceae bacterium]
MNIEQSEGTTVIHRSAEGEPSRNWRDLLVGRPISSAEAPHQTIGKVIGLAVFSSDAMSSVAYGPQEMMAVLILAGTGALHLSVPIAFAIVILLAILTLSYEQTIHAYPGGGGAYIVARDNLGELPAQTAGAALLTDYILTVAVSISSGVAQIVSAYPALYDYRVWIAVAMIMFVMLINLRGVRESGITFAIPTYYFLVMMYITVGFGFYKLLTGTLGTVVNPPIEELQTILPLTTFLVLRAFANGTTALTGVEAISNGITAFREPRSKNAGKTLIMMSFILGSLMLGITYLAFHVGSIPSETETVISQLTRTVYDNRGIFYLLTITSTTVILMMAANTAFADFPRLSALHAGDGFLPRQLTMRGSRLVFSRGIVTLAVISSLLVIGFQASVGKLIPLYAIGVFLSFTLSQTGMARRWWRVGHLKEGEEVVDPGSTLRYEKGWQFKLVVNAIGAIATFTVMIIFAITKFTEGAWIIVVLTPVLVTIFFSIHHHYKNLARKLSMDNYATPMWNVKHRVIVPISGVHRGTLAALQYARSISNDITAVHISMDPHEGDALQKKWAVWGQGYQLLILHSPYRTLLEPLLTYVQELADARQHNELITIVVPQFIPGKAWTKVLHERTAEALRAALMSHKGIIITEVPYHVE